MPQNNMHCQISIIIILMVCEEVITVFFLQKSVYTRNWYRFESCRSRKVVDSNTFLSVIERVELTKEKE